MPLDSHTPTNYAQLDGSDIDLGSASLSILPAPAGSTVAHIGVQTGKDSMLHLIDLDDMSGSGAPGGVGGEIEVIDVPISEFWMKTQSVVWVDTHGDGAAWVYVGNGSGISGLKLTLTGANVPHLQPTWQQNSNATSAIIANDVLYHAGSCAAGNCIIARNPRSGAVLWTSPAIGPLKWGSPILVNGGLYMMSCSGNCRSSGSSTLSKFALPAGNDIIFANGFDG
jgi:outer membrane protein assembly factor BamB